MRIVIVPRLLGLTSICNFAIIPFGGFVSRSTSSRSLGKMVLAQSNVEMDLSLLRLSGYGPHQQQTYFQPEPLSLFSFLCKYLPLFKY